MKEKSEYYIDRIYSHYCSRRPIFGKWKMFVEFVRFLRNPKYLSLSIGKMNNYEADENTEFYYDEDSNQFILKSEAI